MIRACFIALAIWFASAGKYDASAQDATWNEVRWSEWLCREVEKLPTDGDDKRNEYRLPDGSRVDILSDDVAWEVEWCRRSKVFEAIGQSIHYASATGRKPGVWLLKTNERGSDEAYLLTLNMVTYLRGHGIDVQLRVQRVGAGE